MPSPKSAFGAVGTVRNFMSLVKEVDFDEVRERAEHAPRVTLIAPSRETALLVAGKLFGDQPERYVDVRDDSDLGAVDGTRVDAIVVHDPVESGLLERVNSAVKGIGQSQIFFYPSDADGDANAERVRRQITASLPEQAAAFGRHFVPFRPAAVKSIVDDAAKANAQFALVSNIPAAIPILGSFVAASADLIVLTKNQIMMAYKIAAVHGGDLHNQGRLLRELAPVVGVGFLWRTIAREATSFIPLAAGTIPKVAIAFAGTYSTGRAVDYYYRFGNRPDKDQLKQFARQATELAARVNLPLGKGSDSTDVTKS